MKKSEICKKLRPLVRKVIILHQDVVKSAGSGVVIRDDGLVLTARHVIADENGNQYIGQILVSSMASGLIPYVPISPNLKFDMNLPELMGPINFDLTILKPIQPQENIDHIQLSNDLSDIGDDIIMAGFPDDIDEPLHFMSSLNTNNPDIVRMLIEYNNKFKFFFKQLLFKHGII